MGNIFATCCAKPIDRENLVDYHRIKHEYYFKLLILGDQNVGKSTLLQKIVENQQNVDEITNTIGVDFAKKIIQTEDNVIKLHIWDPSGDTRFREILPTYYKGVDGIILLYDISNASTFHSCIENWLPQIRRHAQPNPKLMALVGNKLDLAFNSRDLSVTQCMLTANEAHCMFSEISARETLNLEEFLSMFINELVKRHQGGLE